MMAWAVLSGARFEEEKRCERGTTTNFGKLIVEMERIYPQGHAQTGWLCTGPPAAPPSAALVSQVRRKDYGFRLANIISALRCELRRASGGKPCAEKRASPPGLSQTVILRWQ
jgi:hypothetical protein